MTAQIWREIEDFWIIFKNDFGRWYPTKTQPNQTIKKGVEGRIFLNIQIMSGLVTKTPSKQKCIDIKESGDSEDE